MRAESDSEQGSEGVRPAAAMHNIRWRAVITAKLAALIPRVIPANANS